MSRSKLCHCAAKLCVALFLSVKMGRRLVSPALGLWEKLVKLGILDPRVGFGQNSYDKRIQGIVQFTGFTS